MRTTVTFEGNLADDPQVRFTPSGKQVTEITVLVNERRHNSDGEWVDAEPTRHVVRAFKTLAENIVESLARGDRVIVHGTVTTEAWTDKQTGAKRTAQRVLADIVGPSLRWATTRITKTARSAVDDEPRHDVSEPWSLTTCRGGRPSRFTPGALSSSWTARGAVRGARWSQSVGIMGPGATTRVGIGAGRDRMRHCPSDS
jgi:single-strand DNA-binding protein